jgi:hypothetical protein
MHSEPCLVVLLKERKSMLNLTAAGLSMDHLAPVFHLDLYTSPSPVSRPGLMNIFDE